MCRSTAGAGERRRLLIGGLSLAFLVYNAGYDAAFGGDSPGPRFLVAILPFLAVPLALSYALWPRVTLALALVSALYAVGVTVTGPLQAAGWEWLGELPGTATAPEVARFVPLVIAASLTRVAGRARGYAYPVFARNARSART